MSTQQEREAFIREVGTRDIESVISAIEPHYTFGTLYRAWTAASRPEREAFARGCHEEISALAKSLPHWCVSTG